MKTKNMTNQSIATSINLSLLRRSFLLVPLLLACFGLAPMVQAVGPDTDGAIPGSNNGEGSGVLVNLTNGVWNTGTGFQALSQLTGGNQNTATGLRALFSDTNGGFNTATRVYSLFSNTSGFFNSATGAYSLANNTIGNSNTANGYSALYYNTEGEQNTANGFAALFSNTTGDGNVAVGFQALLNNTTGGGNTANGVQALNRNTTGLNNTAIGVGALLFNTGSDNTALGFGAGLGVSTANGVIAIGTHGRNVGASCFIGNIRGITTANADAIPVLIDSWGQLGTASSSRRFKKEIKPMDQTSEAILSLKPVMFHYKSDAGGTPQFGLIAEEVAEVNPDLVVRDKNGEIYTVRYDAVNAMLLNEFLKTHRNVEEQSRNVQEQEATIAQLKAAVAQQQKDIQALTASLKEQVTQIRKVSAEFAAASPSHRRLAVSKAGPRVVVNDP